MAFGWKMVTQQEETLVECAGPTYSTSLSFRAEAYGALSVVKFIHCLLRYMDIVQMWATNIHMDNVGVITRFNEQYEFDFDYSHNTLQPD
eukprot:9281442-Ditylum_brightwellii.AAC.1